MGISFEGIGQWAATFACGETAVGQVVKVSGSGEVAACADGDSFCGVVVFVARDGEACSVALGGMVRVPYTGTAPALGWTGLAADGSGGGGLRRQGKQDHRRSGEGRERNCWGSGDPHRSCRRCDGLRRGCRPRYEYTAAAAVFGRRGQGGGCPGGG